MFWCSLVELDAVLTLILLIVYGLGNLRNITAFSFDVNFFSRLFPVLLLIGFLIEGSALSVLSAGETCFLNNDISCFNFLSSFISLLSGSIIEWALVALTVIIIYNFRSLESVLLLLFAFIGQYFMLHSVDFLSFFIALEVQNFCFFVLCGLNRERVSAVETAISLKGRQGAAFCIPQSSSFSVEGALKYFLLSAFSSGVMLFWFSAIYLQTGQSSFTSIAPFNNEYFSFFYTFMIVGALMFKLGAAPLHLWVTQIYGNVTRSLLLFVSTAPKLAFFGFWFNTFHSFYFASGQHTATDVNTTVCLEGGYSSILLFAAFSLILGAFAAYSQPALRSLFAYSTINEVGLLLSAVETAGWNTLFQHLGIYLVSQLLLWNCFHRKFLAFLAVSFAGLPPLAGFFGKAWIFWHLSSVGFYSVLSLALLCTLVSLVYYLRLIRLFYEDATPNVYVKYSGSIINKDSLSLLADGLTREKVVATCLILLVAIPFFVLKPSFVL